MHTPGVTAEEQVKPAIFARANIAVGAVLVGGRQTAVVDSGRNVGQSLLGVLDGRAVHN
jgi:hypothetical protein